MAWETLYDWQPLIAISDFIARGGSVIWAIGAVSLMLWTLILERYTFIWWIFPRHRALWETQWCQRMDRRSWYALRIREEMISKARSELSTSVSTIQILVAICPLLGLLGTVTGMIEVFDVIAVAGNSEVRGVSAGVSMATIPTMAGMIVALTGYYFSARLSHLAQLKSNQFAEQLHYN